MKSRHAAFAVGIVLAANMAAADNGSWYNAAGPADRIVGLWSTEGLVGPCNAKPTMPIRNTLLFHAGGTVIESPRFPPGGAPNVANVPGLYQRGVALGTWSYDPRRRTYFVHLQFDNYVDNVYHGYSIVDREIVLAKGGWLGTGQVRSTRFALDGEVVSDVCGDATSARL